MVVRVILEQGKADAIGSIKQKIMDSIDSSNLQNDILHCHPAPVAESPIPLALSSDFLRSLV